MLYDLNFDEFVLEDRIEAANKLLEILPTEQMQKDDWLIVAISGDGVPIANHIAKKLGLYYDVLFTEAVLAPNNKECEIAMVSETEEIVIVNELVEAFDINLDFIYGEAHRKYEEKILKYVYKYRKGDLIGSLENKNVLLVDEGCETGLTVLTSIKTAINAQAKSVAYATPIIPSNVASSLETVTDEVFTVYRVANFVDVDFYYRTTKLMDSDAIKDVIENSPNYLPFQKIGEQKVCNIPLK